MISTRILTVISLFLFGAIYPQNSDAITGRVVSDAGIALAGVIVFLSPIGDSRSGSPQRTTTDIEGYFSFAGLTGKSYTLNAQSAKGYFPQPISEAARRGPYSPGENVTLTMIKGGVITGQVLSPEGDPVVAVPVNAIMVRDRNGRELRASYNSGRQHFTDDLGVYRLYGLSPGSYIVAANSIQGTPLSLYRGETTVFHPSSTRETANEIAVDSGSEVTGIDIRYRGEIGYRVSGSITGIVDSDTKYGTTITLYYAAGKSIVASTGVSPGSSGFEFSGLNDGEYVVTARRSVPDEDGLFASPERVTIKGADVTGINLRLSPFATVAGKIFLEKSPEVSENKCAASIERAAVVIRHDGTDKNEIGNLWQPFGSGATISDTGLFTIRNLPPGRNRIEVRIHQNLYVRSITLPAARVSRRAARSLDISRSGLFLNSGDKVGNLTITLLEGAALLVGKVIVDEGASLPPQIRVFLVPAEITAVDDLLRYFEVQASPQQTYSIRNIPPGKYWLLSRPVAQGPINIPTNPVAWDNNERAKLRKEAESKKIEIDLQPCQQMTDHILKY